MVGQICDTFFLSSYFPSKLNQTDNQCFVCLVAYVCPQWRKNLPQLIRLLCGLSHEQMFQYSRHFFFVKVQWCEKSRLFFIQVQIKRDRQNELDTFCLSEQGYLSLSTHSKVEIDFVRFFFQPRGDHMATPISPQKVTSLEIESERAAGVEKRWKNIGCNTHTWARHTFSYSITKAISTLILIFSSTDFRFTTFYYYSCLTVYLEF